LGFDEKEYDGVTLSYFITDYLERFPKKWEKILLPIKNDNKQLIVEILDVNDSVIWKVKVFVEKK